MLRSATFTATLLASALAASGASAANVSLQQTYSNIFGGNSNSSNVTVQFTDIDTPPDYSTGSINTRGGGFRITEVTTSPANSTDFIMWCVDVQHWLDVSPSGPYNNAPTGSFFSGTPPIGGTAREGYIERLFELTPPTGTPFTVPTDPIHPVDITNGIAAAAFQVALWEVRYETATGTGHDGIDWDASSGNLVASNNLSVINAANDILDDWQASWSDPSLWTNDLVMVYYESLDTRDHYSQHLVRAEPGSNPIDPPIPIPAAFPLLAGGLGFFGLLGWRRKRATA